MCKRISLFFVLSVMAFTGVYSQQITRFAIVDLPKVYTAFFRESKAVRDFEEESAKVQREIDKLTKEIQELRSKYADAVLANNESEALRLENLIYRRSEFLKDYYQAKTAELDSKRSKLMQSGTFLDQIFNEIRFIAESEGYTMVLNKNDPNIVWYSPSIDITEKLILNLQTKNKK
jgi:outer membrane protein